MNKYLSGKNAAVFDIETDGLDPSIIWCISIYDIDKDKMYHFGVDRIQEGVELLSSFRSIIGHNIIQYDLPVIQKLTGVNLSKNRTVIDTLIMSHMSYVKRSKHGLDAWGKEFKYPKVKHEDWSRYTIFMIHRNITDVELNYKVYLRLCTELEKYSEDSIEREHKATVILRRMTERGFPVDVPALMKLSSDMNERKEYIEDKFKDFPKQLKVLGERVGGRGEFAGPYTSIKWEDFNPQSTSQIVKMLEGHWNPIERTKSMTSWKVNDLNLSTLHDDVPEDIKLLPEYFMLCSRTSWISSVFDALEGTESVHGHYSSCGASTHRCTHFNPNMANVAGKKSPYGKEIRESFTGEKDGYVIVGIDAAGIQLRVLAHLMADEDYINEVINGDIHLTNLDALAIGRGELITKSDGSTEWSNRDVAKTFIYSFLLGAGNASIGRTCGVKNGGKIKQQFLDNIPPLGNLMERVRLRKKRIKLIDGRFIAPFPDYCALTPLLQGTEAIYMKECLIRIQEYIDNIGLDAFIGAFVHDEFQILCRPSTAKILGDKCEQIFKEVGEDLGFKLPMEGEAKYGRSWYDTH